MKHNKNGKRKYKNQDLNGSPKFLHKHIIGNGNYNGVLEIQSNGYGYLRKLDYKFSTTSHAPFLNASQIHKFQLSHGNILDVEYKEDKNGNKRVHYVNKINDMPCDDWINLPKFDSQIPIMPNEPILLGIDSEQYDMRAIDIIAPIGKGQRAMIVAPPRTGKTVLLKNISNSICKHYKDIEVCVLLIDERPEEVTDFLRETSAKVFASSNDQSIEHHLRIAEMATGYVKHKMEQGKDCVMLIDSLTRLGRAYNGAQTQSGRTLSGGLDVRALVIPKKIFGTARKFENGGSLTIMATCLIETNSRMDDLIFEEFKGTGNMELVLSRTLANKRLFPAIDINLSGTRNDYKFHPKSIHQRNLIRRYLVSNYGVSEAMEKLLDLLHKTNHNSEIFSQIGSLLH